MDLVYCLNNADDVDQTAIEACDHDVEARLCLQRCGRCNEMSFLVVDGEFRGAESYEAVIETLPDPAEGEGDE